MTVASADASVVTLLGGVSSGSGTAACVLAANVNLFLGPARGSASHPAKSVWCESVGGSHDPLVGPALHYQRSQVRVRVRATRDDYAGGAALARAVWTALDAVAPSGWSVSRCDAPEPRYMGQVVDLHQWEIVATLQRVA
jgi:hypothetical protein